MDLSLLARVLWRFKWVTVTGFVLACFLALMSTARISFAGGTPKLKFRNPVIYSSQARLLVTQAGFPWGRVVLPGLDSSGAPSSSSSSSTYADPSRFSDLAGFYSALVNGDQIQRQVVHPKLQQALAAQAEVDPESNSVLPIVDFTSLAPSPQSAVQVAAAGMAALRTLVATQQTQAAIPHDQRVLLETLEQPTKAKVAVPHKKTVPIVVFMTIILATIGLVLALENLRPLPQARGDVALVAPVEETAADTRSEPSSRRQTAHSS
jgi:hypothetical protein